jgi:hypothetical protein
MSSRGTGPVTASKTVVVKTEDVKDEKTVPPMMMVASDPHQQQQIYIIQTADGAIPVESAEVVVADDMAVYETVSALEQLSRGQVVTTAADGEQLIQVRNTDGFFSI